MAVEHVSSSPQGRTEALARDTETLMLRRARIAMALAASILFAFVFVDRWRVVPEHYPIAVAIRLGGIALLAPLYALTRGPGALARARWVGVGAVVATMTTTAAMMPLFGGIDDAQYAVQGTGMVLCVLGSAVVLPIDGLTMFLLGAVGLALHLAFTIDFPFGRNLAALAATASSVAIATVTAAELTRSRIAEFEGRRAEEALSRARSDFMAMLTHDIKNPLAVIDGFTQVLGEEPDLPRAERDDLLLRIRRAAHSALLLVTNFLDASKIDADRFVLNTAIADPGDLLHASVTDLRSHAEHKGIRVIEERDAMLPPVDVDAGAIGRVLANVIGNAIKHTPAGGTIRAAACGAPDDQVALVVEDTGSGLPPGHDHRIFDRYTGAAGRPDSTGLGLFIAKTLTEAHGGSVRAENRGDGPGARFTILLPSAARRARRPVQPA